jgi:predicted transcriptional regulator
MPQTDETLPTLTADIVAAHVSNNAVAVNDVPALVQKVHDALNGLGKQPETREKSQPSPAVPVRLSVKPDYLVCLVDGTKHKLLKRHLARAHDLTPPQYRQQFGLRPDYPMVAPKYAEQRRDLAKKIGLGTKRRRSATGDGERKGR